MFGDELIHELTKKLGELTQEDMSYINIHFFPTTTNNTGGAGASKEDKSSTARGIMSNKTIEEKIFRYL